MFKKKSIRYYYRKDQTLPGTFWDYSLEYYKLIIVFLQFFKQ